MKFPSGWSKLKSHNPIKLNLFPNGNSNFIIWLRFRFTLLCEYICIWQAFRDRRKSAFGGCVSNKSIFQLLLLLLLYSWTFRGRCICVDSWWEFKWDINHLSAVMDAIWIYNSKKKNQVNVDSLICHIQHKRLSLMVLFHLMETHNKGTILSLINYSYGLLFRLNRNLSLRYSLSALLILVSIALGLLSRHVSSIFIKFPLSEK